MRFPGFLVVWVLALAHVLSGVGCASRSAGGAGPATGLSGHLLLIGGGLEDDNRAVYERFVALSSRGLTEGEGPRVVIATAASLNQGPAGESKIKSIRAYASGAKIDVITRESTTDETVALVDRATAMFFTGGDQKRITTRYLTADGQNTPESLAMRRLLARGGVIAGTSAGDAMMSDPMFLTGRSAEALGMRSTRSERGADDDADDKQAELPLGPQIGKGMGFLPWAIADSHFFERHRFGRLVAALEESKTRLGIGVSENACVEVDLAMGEAVGVSEAESLLVDVGGLEREGLTRRNVRTLVMSKGMVVALANVGLDRRRPWAAYTLDSSGKRVPLARPRVNPYTPARADGVLSDKPDDRGRSASWNFFTQGQRMEVGALTLRLDGYEQRGRADGYGGAIVEVGPRSDAK